jgi:hypothetical protein
VESTCTLHNEDCMQILFPTLIVFDEIQRVHKVNSGVLKNCGEQTNSASHMRFTADYSEILGVLY